MSHLCIKCLVTMVHSLSIIDGTPSGNYAFWALNLSSCVGAFQLEYRMLLVLSSLIVFLSHFVIIIFDRCYVHFWKHFLPWTCQQKLKSILCNAWFFSWWLRFLISCLQSFIFLEITILVFIGYIFVGWYCYLWKIFTLCAILEDH